MACTTIPTIASRAACWLQPWRDVFLDNTVVTNPTWVIASPIMSGQKYLGAILWLSSTRLNTQRILQAARAGVPPVVKAVAQRLQQLSAMSDAAPLWRQVLSTASALLDVPAQPRRLRSQLSGLDSLGPGTPRGPIDMSSDASFVLKSMSAVIDAPSVRCSILKSDAASTQALVRAYEAKIAQHQRTIGSEAPDRVLAEVEVISKAGQVSVTTARALLCAVGGSLNHILWLLVSAKWLRGQLR